MCKRSVTPYLLLAILLLGLAPLLSGCNSAAGPAQADTTGASIPTPAAATPAPTADPRQKVAAEVSQQALKNGEYDLPDLGKVQLADGQYKNQYGSGATQVNQVTFIGATLGDLNGDNVQDGAVVLVVQAGGSGSFYRLVAVAGDQSGARQVGTDALGDRIKLDALTIDQGQIVVNMLTFGPQDPRCCPSQKVTRTYGIRSGSLVLLSETVPAPTPARGTSGALAEESLKNALYDLPGVGKVQLAAGKYEKSTGAGASQVDRVTYLQATLGDLNKDGNGDAAVILAVNQGGSGTFIYLVAVLSQNGSPVQAAVQQLGDRVKIEGLTVDQGKITVKMLTQGPNDPQCCPSVKASKSFVLEGAALKSVE